MSSNPKTTRGNQDQSPPGTPRESRARRNDTPEARQQQAGMNKTHPTRNAQSARKDKQPSRRQA